MILPNIVVLVTSLLFTETLALRFRPFRRASNVCTLSSSGGDDAPAFLKAAGDPSCATVLVPATTTLNIETKMNMTGLSNKHIVRIPLPEGFARSTDPTVLEH